MTKIERQIRFGGDNQPRPEAALEDFALKDKVVELFDATVVRVELRFVGRRCFGGRGRGEFRRGRRIVLIAHLEGS